MSFLTILSVQPVHLPHFLPVVMQSHFFCLPKSHVSTGVNVGVYALFILSFLVIARKMRNKNSFYSPPPFRSPVAPLPTSTSLSWLLPRFFFCVFFCGPYSIDCIATQFMGLWILKSCSLSTLEILSLISMLELKGAENKKGISEFRRGNGFRVCRYK